MTDDWLKEIDSDTIVGAVLLVVINHSLNLNLI
jgi:hypothetical protein